MTAGMNDAHGHADVSTLWDFNIENSMLHRWPAMPRHRQHQRRRTTRRRHYVLCACIVTQGFLKVSNNLKRIIHEIYRFLREARRYSYDGRVRWSRRVSWIHAVFRPVEDR